MNSSQTKLQETPGPRVLHSLKKKVSIANTIITGIFLLAVIILVCIWIWEEFDYSQMYLVDSFFTDPRFRQARSVLVTAYGVCVLLLCVLQCCIQVETEDRESPAKSRRLIWSSLVALIILTFITAAILALTYKADLTPCLKEEMHNSIQEDFLSGPDEFTDSGQLFNNLQSKMQCCGIDSDSDYTGTSFSNSTGLDFPYSCCVLKNGKTGPTILLDHVENWSKCQMKDSSAFHSRGCYDELQTLVSDMCIETATIGFVSAAFLLLATILRLVAECYFERQNDQYLSFLISQHYSNGHQKGEGTCSTEVTNTIWSENHLAMTNFGNTMIIDDLEAKPKVTDNDKQMYNSTKPTIA